MARIVASRAITLRMGLGAFVPIVLTDMYLRTVSPEPPPGRLLGGGKGNAFGTSLCPLATEGFGATLPSLVST